MWHAWIEEGAAVVRRPRESQSSPRAGYKVAPAPATKETPRESQSNPRPPYEIESAEESQGRDSGEESCGPETGPQHADGPDAPREEENAGAGGEEVPRTDESAEDAAVRKARARRDALRQEAATKEVVEDRLRKKGNRVARAEAKKTSEREKEERRKAEAEQGHEPLEKHRSPRGWLEQRWREEFKLVFPTQPLSKWDGKAFGQANKLLDLYDVGLVEDAIVFLIHNWAAIRQKYFKGQGDVVPGLGVLVHFHSSLFPNASVWMQHKEVIDRYTAYDPENLDSDRPMELLRAYVAARKELEALGL